VDWRLLHDINQWTAHRDGVADLTPHVASDALGLLLAALIIYWLSERPRGAIERRVTALQGAAAAGVAMAAAALLRELALRPAPARDHPTQVALLAEAPSVAFPSIAVAGAAAITVALVLGKRRSWVLAMLVALALGASEVADGAAYPSDVLVGATLGVVAAWMACGVARELLDRAARRIARAVDPLLEPIWWWFEWPG
jgi:undecaprenyl-diphosphatase